MAAPAAAGSTFTAEGKTFSVVGVSNDDIRVIDTWLKSHNLPKLGTHLSIMETLSNNALMVVYKSTDRDALVLEMTGDGGDGGEGGEGGEGSVPQLTWLRNCHVKKMEDGERKVTYERGEVTARDRARGCAIEERGRTSDGIVTIGFSAMPEDNITAMRMKIRTPLGIDSGMYKWKCGINVADTMYWVHYLYLELAPTGIVAYMLVEDMQGNIVIAEAPVEPSIVTAFSAAFA